MHLDDLIRNVPSDGHIKATQPRITRGLVLMGGGARTAYQAGALQALAQLLSNQHANHHAGAATGPAFPFQILVGTSAGALNATYLASRAMEGLSALREILSISSM